MASLLKYYRYVLLFLLTFLFFSNIPGYLSMPEYASYISIIPSSLFGKYFQVIILASLFLFSWIEPPRSFVKSKLLYWILFYLSITFIWLLFDDTESQLLIIKERVTKMGYFLCFLLLFSSGEKLQTLARWAILVAVLLAIANNVFDFFNPFYFIPAGDEFSNPGRAAGFFINANRAGAALVVGMLFTITLISEKYRVPYALLIFIGVLFTFSRMSIIAFGILIVIILIQRNINKKQLLVGAICLIAIVTVSLPMISKIPLSTDSLVNIENRIEWLIKMGQRIEDESVSGRKEIAALSLELISESPLVGHGVDSITRWSTLTSSHNIYLYHMADHGIIIGILIMPLLIMGSIWKSQGETRQLALSFGVIIIFIGFFSHNILDEFHYLIGFALMGAMAFQSSKYVNVNLAP